MAFEHVETVEQHGKVTEYSTREAYVPKNEDVYALSYSAGNTLATCEFKYALEKVWKVKPDDDAVEDTVAFRWGKACHKVMEDTEWEFSNFNDKIFEDSCLEQGFYRVLPSGRIGTDDPQITCAIYAAIMSLFQLAKKQKLRTVKCEYEIKLPYLYGFIDAICEDALGGWWIRDLKTSGRIAEDELLSRLTRDRQLNLYALPEVLALIERDLGLKEEDFLGVRYTVVFKTTTKPKADETPKVYASRVQPKVLDVEIPRELLDPEGAKQAQMASIQRGLEIRNGLREPLKNIGSSSCYSYSRPCSFWSHCYGTTATKSKDLCKSYTLDDAKDLSRSKEKGKKTKINKVAVAEVLTADDIKDTNWEDLF